jgi:RNA polymerase sigma-70 factor, ECF subfamily
MDHHSSQQLLSEAKGGSRDALGRLLHQLRPYLRIVARGAHRGTLVNQIDDSDLVQDAIVEVTRSFERFRGAEVPEFLAWLRQVVSNTVHKSIRQHVGTKKRNAGRIEPGQELDHIPGLDHRPERIAQVREEAARLAEVIEKLPMAMQQVLHMRLIDDLPHAQIAVQLGRSEQATRMLFVRAIRKLRELFDE